MVTLQHIYAIAWAKWETFPDILPQRLSTRYPKTILVENRMRYQVCVSSRPKINIKSKKKRIISGCAPVKVWFLQRHGTRNPKKIDMRDYPYLNSVRVFCDYQKSKTKRIRKIILLFIIFS